MSTAERCVFSQPLNVKGRALPVTVRLLQRHADQHAGRGRQQPGAGRRVPAGGERALQQTAGEHAAEQHPGPHQRLQQRSEVGTSSHRQPPAATAAANGKLRCFVCLCASRPQHPERHLQLGGAERRLHEQLPEGPHAHLAVLRQLHRLLQDLPR